MEGMKVNQTRKTRREGVDFLEWNKISMCFFKNFVQQHMEWHKTSTGLECRVCNHQLNDKHAYETHLNLHETVPKNQCVICGKANENSSRLKYHARVHVSEYWEFETKLTILYNLSPFNWQLFSRARRKFCAITAVRSSIIKPLWAITWKIRTTPFARTSATFVQKVLQPKKISWFTSHLT